MNGLHYSSQRNESLKLKRKRTILIAIYLHGSECIICSLNGNVIVIPTDQFCSSLHLGNRTEQERSKGGDVSGDLPKELGKEE